MENTAQIFIGLLGILLVLAIAYAMSNNKKNINGRAIVTLLVTQVVVILLMFKTSFGLKVVEVISTGVNKILSYGTEGINFVLGGLVPEGVSIFFINVLMVIIFTSTLLSILTHIKLLPIAIKYIGGAISKVTGLPNVITFNSVNSIFFGQSESILAVKNHLDKMSDNKLFIISTSAMASVSASIMGAYMTMIPAKYVLVAMLLNSLSSLIVASIVAPVTGEPEEPIDIKEVSQSKSIFEAISTGALDGGKVSLIVAAMLVAYIGLIAMLNGLFSFVFGMDLTTIIGYVFAPIAAIMGIMPNEIVQAGSIMGMKLATNEFVAMLAFQPMIETLTPKTVAIVSTFLVSFANFSSIGIIGGSIQAINGEKASVVAKFGLKMLLVATMASVLSATMVGLFS